MCGWRCWSVLGDVRCGLDCEGDELVEDEVNFLVKIVDSLSVDRTASHGEGSMKAPNLLQVIP